MEKIYEDFFYRLLQNVDNLSDYVDSLYKSNEFTDNDLNQIFGALKKEGLISCLYADDRAWVQQITFKGKHYFDNTRTSKVPRLLELIAQMDNVENAFHEVGGNGIPKVDEIHDTQIFQDWIQEIKFELQELSEIKKDEYILDTLSLASSTFNGWNDRKQFAEIKGRLKVINRNHMKYFSTMEDLEKGNNVKEKKPLIFISHSSQNKEQVEKIVELLRTINLQPQKDVFCSSLPGYDITIGMDIFEFLRSRFIEYDLHIICIHSPEYYQSAVSLNEMGAAWALKNKVTSILLPGYGFEGMKGVINDRTISIKLDNDINEVKDKLNQLRKMLVEEFKLVGVPDITWEIARDKFIDAVNCTKTQGRLKEETIILLKKIAATSDGMILITADLSIGKTIQIGDEVIVSEYPNRREFTKWDSALKECVNLGYIEQRSKEMFSITQEGYLVADK